MATCKQRQVSVAGAHWSLLVKHGDGTPCRPRDRNTSGSPQRPWALAHRQGRHCHANATLCHHCRTSEHGASSRNMSTHSRSMSGGVGGGAYCSEDGNVTPESDESLLSLRNRALGTQRCHCTYASSPACSILSPSSASAGAPLEREGSCVQAVGGGLDFSGLGLATIEEGAFDDVGSPR